MGQRLQNTKQSNRKTANLKRSRTNLDEATVSTYFDNFEKELVGE